MFKNDKNRLYTPGRIETLTDGIFAIAMTLLILNIEVPDFGSLRQGETTMTAVKHILPQIVNYIISFVILGSFWLTHHSMFDKLQKVNSSLMLINIVFLLFSALIPFSTILIDNHGQYFVSAILFNFHIFLLNLLTFVQLLIIHWDRNLLKTEFSDYNFQKTKRKILFITFLSFSAIIISFVSPKFSTLVYLPIPFIFFL